MNLSRAVVERRVDFAPDALDYFPTPPWAARAMAATVTQRLGVNLSGMSCWEPACGELHMVKGLRDCFASVRATDVFRYSPDHGLCDFLTDGRAQSPTDAIVTNPPFILSAQFLQMALAKARHFVAFLVRSSWLEGGGRYSEIFSQTPPSLTLTHSERVVMLKGRLVQAGKPDPFNLKDGKPVKATTATSYSWCVWWRPQPAGPWSFMDDPRHGWIAPQREAMERPGDYPDHSALLAEIEARAQALHGGGASLFDERKND